jgi:hypothetical protein
MATLVTLPTFRNEVGSLSVFEQLLPGEIKRVFYIHGTPETARRAGHAHVHSHNALACVAGSCRVFVADGRQERHFTLSQPDECLVLAPGDWHVMDRFSSDAVLLVISNALYDPAEYVLERPGTRTAWEPALAS